MKTIRKTAGRALALLIALVLACGMALSAYAADTATLDLSQTGSIELTLADADGNVVSGGAVTLYKVASLYLNDGNMAYRYTSAFSGCGVTLDVEDTSLAQTLADYVESKGISGTTLSIGTSGTVSFGGLDLGLYLLVQTTESDNYKTISPFVVTVPIENGGVWDYTVNASPKVGTVTLVEPDEPEPEDKTPTPTLPQTGQLNWPIPLLAFSGVVLFAAGWYLNRTDRKRTEYAR